MLDSPIKPEFVLDVYMSTLTLDQIDALSSLFEYRWRQDSFVDYTYQQGYEYSEDGTNPVAFLDSMMHEVGVEKVILLVSW